MKIKSIKIKNFRSVKDDLIIENIGDSLILTGKNNSGKSSIINALAIFLGEKEIYPVDFYNGTNEINIGITFGDIDDEYLRKFVEYKKTSQETRKIEQNFPDIFDLYRKDKIERKDDLETEDQIQLIEKLWIEDFKATNNISNNILQIELKILKENNKITQSYSIEKIGGVKIEKSGFFPKVIFIDDERNFTNEQDGKTGSITQNIFGGIKIKKDEEVLIDELDLMVKMEGKGVKDLEIHHLEKLLKEKANEKSKEIGDKVTENFCNYYSNGYEIKVTPETTINHKTFSLGTTIIDPIIGETPLSNVGAGLRALYLLALLKAYNTIQKNENTIFIIEEPELYLHPGLQKRMGEVLSEIAKEQQLFITTHSPIILRKFNIEDIKEITKCSIENKTKISNGDLNKILEKLGYSIFDIIKYKYLIFVEGKDDYNILYKLINKLYPTKKDEVEIIISNGCGNLKYYASLKFLGLLNRGEINYLILRDRDNQDDIALANDFETNLISKDIKQDFINELKEKLKILDRYSIENYFLDETKIKLFFTSYNLEEFISNFDMLEDSTKDSIKKGFEIQFQTSLTKLKSDYSEEYLKIRGHNIFNALIYYINGNEKRYIYDESKRNEYIDFYINNSGKEDFLVLTQYLDELFGITN